MNVATAFKFHNFMHDMNSKLLIQYAHGLDYEWQLPNIHFIFLNSTIITESLPIIV